MKSAIIIPARYASSRYPGKPLVELKGASGRSLSLIQRSWDAAKSVAGVSDVFVATDDPRIQEAAQGFGASVIMTDPDCANGTERCAQAHERLGHVYDVIVNLQGDAPLTPAWFITEMLDAMQADPSIDVATPVLQCDGRALTGFLEDRKAGRVGGTTAVFSRTGQALYFSKEVIPYRAYEYPEEAATPVFHHVGAYGYRREALSAYSDWQAGPLEELEGLEQLRFLENDASLHCVVVEAKGREFWELNNPEDVPKLEAMMARMGIE